MTQQPLFNGTSPAAWRARQFAQTQARERTVAELLKQNDALQIRNDEVKEQVRRAYNTAGLIALWAGLATFGFVVLLGIVAGGGA
jgi:hypothetical protein